jgi:putative oxidoreductase
MKSISMVRNRQEESQMTTSGQLSKIIFMVGRLIVGGVYLGAGIENLMQLDAKGGYAASKGVTNATFWVTVASLLLLFGGASLITGIRPWLGVAALALFLVPVTLIMHNFWTMQGLQAEIEQHAFLGNVGLFGSALLLLAIPQPWAMSLDKLIVSKAAARRMGREKPTLQQGTPSAEALIK